MSSEVAQLSEWKTVKTDTKVTYNECKNKKLSHLVSEMEFVESKLEKACGNPSQSHFKTW